jgi:signal transduction histidine kinase/ActR/RegA family two-component response regulator
VKRLTDLASQLALLYRHGPSIGVDFNTIADHLSLHVSLKGSDLRYRYINMPGQVQHLLPNALSGQLSDADLLGADVAQWRVQADRKAMACREPQVVWSDPCKRPDGSIERQPQVKIGLHDDRGQPLGVMDVAPAPSGDNHAAAKVQRMNQALDLITDVLGLLMRHEDETALLERVCSTLVVRGCYLAAAIVPVDATKRMAHVPLCLAGDRAELALPGPFRLDDDVWETHPVARAAESGMCVVHKDHPQDDQSPWRLSCPTVMAQALVALPLKVEDDVFAVLLLACDGIDSFAPSRAVLLQRMADELSLGIELMRSKARLASERQQREIHLRQQLATSQRLSLATESADVGLWEWDLARGTVLMDDRVTTQLGLPSYARTLPMATLMAWVHPDQHTQIEEASKQVGVLGQPADVIVRITPPDGRERVIRIHMSPLMDEVGHITGVLGACQDVTDPTRHVQRLKDLGAKLQLATEATGLGIWELELSEHKLILDKRASQIHGLNEPQSVVTWAAWLQWVHPAQRSEVQSQIAQGLRQSGSGQIECALTPPDGLLRRVLLNWASQAQDDGQVSQMVGTLIDITEKRRGEARVAQTHQRLALLAGATGVGQWRYDLQEGFSFDDAMCRLLGVTTSPVPATAWLMEMCLPSSQREALELALITADEQLEVSLHWQGLDGVSRRVIWMGTVERDARRTVIRGEGLCIDVTVQHQLNEALHHPASRQGPSETGDRRALVMRIGNELRSPLNAMLGFVQLLRKSPTAERALPFDEYLAHVEQAGWHMLEMVNDVMDLSRIESGQAPVDIEAISLVDLMGELLPLIEQLAAVQQVRIDLQDLGAWPSVKGDRRLLKQAMVNVASHAIGRSRAFGVVTLAFEPMGSEVAIKVRDQGPLLTPDQVTALFDPYQTLTPELARGEAQHLTMRMAISRQSMASIGGRIQVDNQPGMAVALSVVLPRAQPLAGEALPMPPRMAMNEAVQLLPSVQGKVLYVEDNPSNVLLVRESLGLRPGVELVVAGNVHEGLGAVARQRFDLVLLDLQLPDGDGYEVLQALRAQPHGQQTPCIAVTANAMINERNRALEAGFDEFWTKPLNLPAFLTGLDQWMDRKSNVAPRA